ncbi:MAG: SAM-dependent methyltransferase [Verrucomicrobiota bacterium]
MGSSTDHDLAPSPEFLAAFGERANADGVLTFAAFMDLALYHPVLGYYRRDRRRVGRTAEADFYTATSSGPIFGELVAAAATELLGAGVDARDYTFVEIGAEPGGGVLARVAHPFGAERAVRVGETAGLTGKCVVFSNELFDAQPLRRFVRAGGVWRELGVQRSADGTLSECVLPGAVREPWLPEAADEGYVFDAPRAAAGLAEALADGAWQGLFIAFDYGKSAAELGEHCPHGTVRAYHRHRQHNGLLERPGEQDLTGHVCWDWLAAALSGRGFRDVTVESQEAFFMRRAGGFLARTLADEGGGFSQKKLALMQLLHPGNLGQKFQVLHARR